MAAHMHGEGKHQMVLAIGRTPEEPMLQVILPSIPPLNMYQEGSTHEGQD